MEKEKIFSKFNVKDYNTKLEEILEKKHYNEEAENLLLSMFYKIENAYKDYSLVKFDTFPLNEFIDYLIDIIENCCDEIKVIKPQMGKKIKPYNIDKENKSIEVFPNEENLLYALIIIGFKKINPPILYFSRCIISMLENGTATNKSSIIRDFNGWSWDIGSNEIQNFEYNIIYNNILLLLGYDFITINIKNKKICDVMNENLKNLYSPQLSDKFLIELYKILAGAFSNDSSRNKKITLREIENIKQHIAKLEDRDTYIKEVTYTNSKKLKQIRCIDKIITNIDLIRKEFILYNHTHQDNKVFSISDYVEKLENDRQDRLDIIAQNNDLINPSKYIQRLSEIRKRLKDLQDLEIEKNDKCNLDKIMISLQKIFLEMYSKKILKTEGKRNLINLVYEFRYYNSLPYKKGIKLKFDSRLNGNIEKTGKQLIKTLENAKVLEKISDDANLDYLILKYLFNTKMIKLENMYIKVNKYTDKIEVEYYDTNMLEDRIEINLNENQNLKIRKDKKIKLFI